MVFRKWQPEGDSIAVVFFWILRDFLQYHPMEHLLAPVYVFID